MVTYRSYQNHIIKRYGIAHLAMKNSICFAWKYRDVTHRWNENYCKREVLKLVQLLIITYLSTLLIQYDKENEWSKKFYAWTKVSRAWRKNQENLKKKFTQNFKCFLSSFPILQDALLISCLQGKSTPKG